MHRVLDVGIERFSCPFFLRPKYVAKIPSDMWKSAEEKAAEELVIFGE